MGVKYQQKALSSYGKREARPRYYHPGIPGIKGNYKQDKGLEYSHYYMGN